MVKRGSERVPRQAPGSGHGRERGARTATRPEDRRAAGPFSTGEDDIPAAESRAEVRQRGRERAVLVGVATGKVARPTVEAHLDELAQLVDTAGGEAVARMVQERKSPDPTFFIGKGKVGELASLAKVNGAKLVLFDDDLTPSQVRHLEEELPDGVKCSTARA